MILTSSPLRVSLGGGGTDLPSYYKEHEGFLVSASIDKYVYVSIIKRFVDQILIKYSNIEQCNTVLEIKHPIIRESMKIVTPDEKALEIVTMADIPTGTGLGSSGSFTTALLKALLVFKNKDIKNDELAELACQIELEKLNEPIGKQDQYISAFGGITAFTFCRNGQVKIEPLKIDKKTLSNLEDNLLLFFTGFSRSASEILKVQNNKTKDNNLEMINNLHYVKEIGLRSKQALELGNIRYFGELMHEHWKYKKKRSIGMINEIIDKWYELGLNNGAIGGKLVGAGGGGFLMFLANDRNKLREAMFKAGLEEVKFKFVFEGTKTILYS